MTWSGMVGRDEAARARAAGRVCAAGAALVLVCVTPTGTAAVTADAAGGAKKSAAALTAAEIVAKNVAARGGLETWRKVQTMVWTGHLESSRTPAPSMPFLLDQKRPNKTRFEVQAMSEHSVRVFDGEHGWKSHDGAGGQSVVQPFTPEETRFASGQHTIDGPLMDLPAKGSTVGLRGIEPLEGHKVYHLSVHLVNGELEEVWIDTKTFLDVKVARITYGPDKTPRMVPTLYRDYKNFEGLQIPTTIQIGDGSTGTPDRMRIEQVAVNMGLDDRLFEKPGAIGRRHMPGPGAPPAPQASGN
jgi:hypothetical protein